jgi:hypothetical protein
MRPPHRSRASTTVTLLPARPKLTGSHQARSARADDHELAANECQVHAAPVEWPRSAAAPAGSNQEKLGGDAMTEKTVRPHSVLRRTMLVGTAGVLGGAVLRSTPVQSHSNAWPPATRPTRRPSCSAARQSASTVSPRRFGSLRRPRLFCTAGRASMRLRCSMTRGSLARLDRGSDR